eukprot:m51a1_g3220 putative fatty-acid- ligase fadd9 (1567) ;mRNA; f:53840-61856
MTRVAFTFASVIWLPALLATAQPACLTIFCDERLLEIVRQSRLFPDSKSFTDTPLLRPQRVVREDLLSLGPAPNRTAISGFLARNFNWSLCADASSATSSSSDGATPCVVDGAGSDIEQWSPLDWTPVPPALEALTDAELRKWSLEVHSLWNILGRRVRDDVLLNPERHSLMAAPHPFIAPGGRFREFYYWDTYWIIRGLIISRMHDTALGMVKNMLWDYEWWMTEPNTVVVMDKEGRNHTLNRYYARSDRPRPEGYAQDVEVAKEVPPKQRTMAKISLLNNRSDLSSLFTARAHARAAAINAVMWKSCGMWDDYLIPHAGDPVGVNQSECQFFPHSVMPLWSGAHKGFVDGKVGFGWTNGVTLEFLVTYSSPTTGSLSYWITIAMPTQTYGSCDTASIRAARLRERLCHVQGQLSGLCSPDPAPAHLTRLREQERALGQELRAAEEELRAASEALPLPVAAGVEFGWACDACGAALPRGTARWHCTECPDYDLCAACHGDPGRRPHAHACSLETLGTAELRREVLAQGTFAAMVWRALGVFATRPCLGARGRPWVSFGELGARVAAAARGLRAACAPSGLAGSSVALCGRNTVGWFVADLACVAVGAVSVPVHAAADAETVRHVLSSTSAEQERALGQELRAAEEELRAASEALPLAVAAGVEFGWACDACGAALPRGTARWHCTECPDYDLCAACHGDPGRRPHAHACSLETLGTAELRREVLAQGTFAAMVWRALGVFATRPCLGARGRPWVSFGELGARVAAAARGLRAACAPAGLAGSSVALCGRNTVGWFVADLACVAVGAVSVPVHAAADAETVRHVLSSTSAVGVMSDAEHAPMFAQSLSRGEIGFLVCTDDAVDGGPAAPLPAPCTTSLSRLQQGNEGLAFEPHEWSPPDVVTVIFTRRATHGTTGVPKGIARTDKIVREGLVWADPPTDDPYVSISKDSLAHLSDRENVYYTLINGGRVGLCPHIENVFEDIREFSPTSLVAVPRFWNVLFTEYQRALQALRQSVDPSLEPVKYDAERTKFLIDCWGRGAVFEGYGCSETGPIAGDNGVIFTSVKWQLVDCPELGYLQSDLPNPRGEIIVKTPHMISSYYASPEQSALMFDSEGWFHTGDIVELVGPSQIRIIDRKKNIFKLAQGEFVSAEHVEHALARSPLVKHIFVTCADIGSYDQTAVTFDSAAAAVFLTGATGFLGSHILADVLETTDKEIYCLVRCWDAPAGMQRLEAALRSYDLLLTQSQRSRIRVVAGTLEAPCFGLSESEFSALSQAIGSIIHCGARVNHIEPYARLRCNVTGTIEALRLACAAGVRSFVYVGSSSASDSEGLLGLTRIATQTSGYAQSKWVSESLVLRSAEECGLGAVVFRVAMLSWSSRTGAPNTRDWLFRLIEGCVEVGCFPRTKSVVSVTPVDVAARVIVQGGHDPANLGKSLGIVNPFTISFSELAQWLASCGALAWGDERVREGIASLGSQVYHEIWNERVARLHSEAVVVAGQDAGTSKASAQRRLSRLDALRYLFSTGIPSDDLTSMPVPFFQEGIEYPVPDEAYVATLCNFLAMHATLL